MTIEEIKRRAELYSALAEGKTIQVQNPDDKWVDIKPEKLNYIPDNIKFRIKPEPTYRPFKSQEECWQEMQKHQPFGWITLQCGKKSGSKASIIKLTDNCFYFVDDGSGICHNLYNYEFDKHFWLFADGTPFGIKEE